MEETESSSGDIPLPGTANGTPRYSESSTHQCPIAVSDIDTLANYRLYMPDCVIPCITAFDPNDPYLGCVCANEAAPPHTTLSLKHCLAKNESIEDYNSASLYFTIASGTAKEGLHKIDLMKEHSPGTSAIELVALLVNILENKVIKFLSARCSSGIHGSHTCGEGQEILYALILHIPNFNDVDQHASILHQLTVLTLSNRVFPTMKMILHLSMQHSMLRY